jgi:hypothetical protein
MVQTSALVDTTRKEEEEKQIIFGTMTEKGVPGGNGRMERNDNWKS